MVTGGCRCGDTYCADTFGKATAGQDRSGCCLYCGWSDCDVCRWTATATATPDGAAGDVCASAADAGDPF